MGREQAQKCQRKSLKDHIFLLSFTPSAVIDGKTTKVRANVAFHTHYLQSVLYHTHSKVVRDKNKTKRLGY